jgi:hypothetical protein
MLAAGGPALGLRTLQTHLAREGLNVRADGRSPGRSTTTTAAAPAGEAGTTALLAARSKTYLSVTGCMAEREECLRGECSILHT